MADPAGRTAAAGARLRWADLAKGVSILLVVLAHVSAKHFDDLGDMAGARVVGFWQELNLVLTPIRMPVFFVVSGMLAAAALQRPWRAVATRRIASPYYLYVLWVVLSAAVYAVLRTNIDYLYIRNASELLPSLVLPNSTLWYLYALAAYFVVAKLLKDLPAAWVIAPAALLSAVTVAGWLPVTNLHASTLRNLVFFLVGAYGPSLVKGVAAGFTWPRFATAVALYAGAAAAYAWDVYALFGVQLLAGFAGIWFGVLAASALSRVDGISDGLVSLGRRTLPIFVLHVPVIAVVSWVTHGPGRPVWSLVLGIPLVAAVYPVVLGAFVVAVCLLAHRVALLVGATWLFGIPGRTAPRSLRAGAPAAAPADPRLTPTAGGSR